jgi:acetyl-CoA C-acetyltransferase
VDPRTPVIVGAAQLLGDGTPQEPIAMMETVVRAAAKDSSAADLLSRIGSVRVVRGINPYRDPGRLVADRLGLHSVPTVHTQIGGQEAYDLVGRSAASILAGEVDAVAICGAEALRTRRGDRAAGNTTSYLPEADDAAPQETHGRDEDFWDDLDTAARTNVAVNFYALAESARRHRAGESVDEHLVRISELWATASAVAADNPHAVLRDRKTAEQIRTPSAGNRMVADPYPKLMTSNVNVDMAAGLIMCSAETATAAGVPRDRWVFPLAASGAYDHWQTRSRWELDRSPAMRLAGQALLSHLGTTADAFDHVDLYTCFPVAVQVAHEELGRSAALPFTITGGLTFNGGPLNTYCLHPLARAVELLRAEPGRALLTGNGGFFTKHAVLALGTQPDVDAFHVIRPQAAVDALPQRPLTTQAPDSGRLEAYTTVFDRDGEPSHSILSVIGDLEQRTWARVDDPEVIDQLRTTDSVGSRVSVQHSSDAVPAATII